MCGFVAAFGSTASVAMFHIAGITPEAPDVQTAVSTEASCVAGGVWIFRLTNCLVRKLAHREPEVTVELEAVDLAGAWRALDSCGRPDETDRIELVAVGNPHLSLSECATLAGLCDRASTTVHPEVSANTWSTGWCL